MSKTIVISNRGGGFVTATQDADSKQLSTDQIEKLVTDFLRKDTGVEKPYKLQAVNNATDSRKVNPRMREHSPDSRVYTLLLASKVKK
jgi:hypothetical protein